MYLTMVVDLNIWTIGLRFYCRSMFLFAENVIRHDLGVLSFPIYSPHCKIMAWNSELYIPIFFNYQTAIILALYHAYMFLIFKLSSYLLIINYHIWYSSQLSCPSLIIKWNYSFLIIFASCSQQEDIHRILLMLPKEEMLYPILVRVVDKQGTHLVIAPLKFPTHAEFSLLLLTLEMVQVV